MPISTIFNYYSCTLSYKKLPEDNTKNQCKGLVTSIPVEHEMRLDQIIFRSKIEVCIKCDTESLVNNQYSIHRSWILVHEKLMVSNCREYKLIKCYIDKVCTEIIVVTENCLLYFRNYMSRSCSSKSLSIHLINNSSFFNNVILINAIRPYKTFKVIKIYDNPVEQIRQSVLHCLDEEFQDIKESYSLQGLQVDSERSQNSLINDVKSVSSNISIRSNNKQHVSEMKEHSIVLSRIKNNSGNVYCSIWNKILKCESWY